MDAPSPSTPEPVPRHASQMDPPPSSLRRSFTVPTKFVASAAAAVDSVESLFEHPNAKVLSFTISPPKNASGSDSETPGSPAVASLPWRSTTESTMATGPLRIYRVPSSGVAFLHSGSFLRHILPKSQCWCVDEVSKFVMRVNMLGSFYRIELPAETDEDKERVEHFKVVLKDVLQYETAPSPFKTGQLGSHLDRPATPARKDSVKPLEKAKKWRFDKVWEPEDNEHRERIKRQSIDSASFSPARRLSRQGERLLSHSRESSTNRQRDSGSDGDGSVSTPSKSKVEEIRKAFIGPPPSQPTRSMTMPTALVRRPITPPKEPEAESRFDTPQQDDQDNISQISGNESFYSAESVASGSYGTAAASQADDEEDVADSYDWMSHQINASTRTLQPRPAMVASTSFDSASGDSGPPTPTPFSVGTETISEAIRLRRLPRQLLSSSRSRSVSPFPGRTPMQLLSPPQSPNPTFVTTLVQKAYSLLIGPSAQLIALMLSIAARVVRGLPIVYRAEEQAGANRMPGRWESSADEAEDWDDDELDPDEEDDFGIPLGNLRRKPSIASWPSISRRVSASSVTRLSRQVSGSSEAIPDPVQSDAGVD